MHYKKENNIPNKISSYANLFAFLFLPFVVQCKIGISSSSNVIFVTVTRVVTNEILFHKQINELYKFFHIDEISFNKFSFTATCLWYFKIWFLTHTSGKASIRKCLFNLTLPRFDHMIFFIISNINHLKLF